MSGKVTLAGRQKNAIVLIFCAVVLLIVALLVVNYLVSMYDYVDTDGTKYIVKREGSSYALFDQKGYMLDTTIEDGKEYFVTDAGTMVAVTASGKTSVYAVVDTGEGESVSAYNRLMIYPKVESTALKSLRIKNQHGSYTFERNNNGNIVLRGFEQVSYNAERYAYLSGLCGNLVVMDNGRFSEKVIAKYGLAEYGLDEPQATFTITSSGGKSYTILVGDAVVSGNGYYVMFEGREVVYIINAYYGMLLDPVESYISPALTYGVTANNYPEVQNFRVYDYTYDADGKPSASMITALTYWPYEERENTEYQTQTYKMIDQELLAYVPESSAVTSTMEKLIMLENAKVVKLGVNDKVLTSYGLDKPETLLSYDFTSRTEKATLYLRNRYWFSPITERGTHYVYAEVEVSEDGETYLPMNAYDYVLEVGLASLSFLSWNKIDWVEAYYFHINIMLMESMEVITPEGKILFDFEIGKDDVEKITATMNGEKRSINIDEYKKMYRNMLFGVLFDETDKTEQELREIVEDENKLQLSYRVKTKKTDKTEGVDNTYSFYNLGESRSYLTINGGGEFYVLSNDVLKTAEDAMKLWRGEPIESLLIN